MASPAQIAANRRNARKSTGPTTAEGKSRVSRNAITHGVRSTGDPAALQQLVAALTAQHRPVGAAQELCILRIALAILKINYSDYWENEVWMRSGSDYADLDALERAIHIKRHPRPLSRPLAPLVLRKPRPPPLP
jgi:hypothetical protein